MGNVEQFNSSKATVETRYNEKQDRYRVHITAGKRRLGPVFVRLPGGDGDAADAARVALERAVKRKEIDLKDLDHDDGEIGIEHEGVRRRSTAARKPSPMQAVKAKPEGSVARRARPTASARPISKVHAIVGNGAETRAAERRYAEAAKEYHAAGDAVRERHEVLASVAAGG